MRIVCLVLLCAAAACAADVDASQQLLRWMDGMAQKYLDQRASVIKAVRTREQAVARQQAVREKVLTLMGGLPDYNGPLHAKVTGTLRSDGYRVDKVLFESLPGIWVTGNLYLPSATGKHPAVLTSIGHWESGKPAVQQIAGNLAQKGFVAFAYDPLGQGERLQGYVPAYGKAGAGGSVEQHLILGGQSILLGQSYARYRIWDAKRALDYLVSRPEVDAERIGCTGCSGGGTVATFISALDPRIKVAAPTCYLNSFRVLFRGPVGDSEQSIPGFLSSGLDQTDLVELFAPKPWLIGSTLEDFFVPEGARQVYEEARHWYRLFGAEDRIQWAIGPGPHGTPRELRERIYEWMIRWLNDGKGDPTDQAVKFYPDHELWASRTGQVSQEPDLQARDLHRYLAAEYRPPQTRNMPSVSVPAGMPEAQLLDKTVDGELTSTTVRITVDPGLMVQGMLYQTQQPGAHPAVLLVRTRPSQEEQARMLAKRGATVLLLSPRGLPTSLDNRPFSADWITAARALLLGEALPVWRARDIVLAARWLAARPEVAGQPLRAAALDNAGIWLLLAATAEPQLKTLWLDRTPKRWSSALQVPITRDLYDAILPGALLQGDIPDLLAGLSNRRVLWTDETDWMRNVLPSASHVRTFQQSDERFWQELLR